MHFAAAPSAGRWIGIAMLALCLVVELALVGLMWRVGPGPSAAIMLVVALALAPLTAYLAYWVWGCLSLGYDLGRDGVVIRWAASNQIVPMASITHVLGGRPYSGPLEGFRWPGHEIGHTQIATDDGRTRPALVYSSRPPAEQLLIVTSALAYAISPADRSAFVAEFRMRRRLGPVQDLRQETYHLPWAGLTLWRDGLALRLIGVALALGALATAWLVWHYPALPSELPLQPRSAADAAGVAAALRPRYYVWGLPAIGLATAGFNTVLAALVHRRARLAALFLVAGTVLFQLALWGVVLRLV